VCGHGDPEERNPTERGGTNSQSAIPAPPKDGGGVGGTGGVARRSAGCVGGAGGGASVPLGAQELRVGNLFSLSFPSLA